MSESDTNTDGKSPEEPEQILELLSERETELQELEAELAAFEAELAPEILERVRDVKQSNPEVFRSEPIERPVILRDPAVIELLKQSAALTARYNHLSANVDNLHTKFDRFADESLAWHRRREEWEKIQIETARKAGEAATRDNTRKIFLAAIFLVVVIAWYWL